MADLVSSYTVRSLLCSPYKIHWKLHFPGVVWGEAGGAGGPQTVHLGGCSCRAPSVLTLALALWYKTSQVMSLLETLQGVPTSVK